MLTSILSAGPAQLAAHLVLPTILVIPANLHILLSMVSAIPKTSVHLLNTMIIILLNVKPV